MGRTLRRTPQFHEILLVIMDCVCVCVCGGLSIILEYCLDCEQVEPVGWLVEIDCHRAIGQWRDESFLNHQVSDCN